MKPQTALLLGDISESLLKIGADINHHLMQHNPPVPSQVPAEPGYRLATDGDKELPRGCRYRWDGCWHSNDNNDNNAMQHSRSFPHEIPLAPYPSPEVLAERGLRCTGIMVRIMKGDRWWNDQIKDAVLAHEDYGLYQACGGFGWIVEDDPDADTRPLLSSVEFTLLVNLPDAELLRIVRAFLNHEDMLWRHRDCMWHDAVGCEGVIGSNDQWIIAADVRDDRKDGSK